ncbi:hypothetical protein O3G_MSEX004219 [Manduca sexta]|uniref:Glutathione peroxidase n=1 Tax=Manduca sexta TaxID=7130 RepID=A0A921YU42_MANSE|nr:hypothetical protein O3G_MSEX004219 [Manduca sexta]
MNKSVTNVINPDYNKARSIHEFTVKNAKGENVKLEAYKGHVCIIVNVSSKCGFTAHHYAQFNELVAKYGENKGLTILAFPCWQFSGEEKETLDYALYFDMYDKVDVNGEGASPLWKFLKLKQGTPKGNFIKWNFTKFIINKDGVPVERHECKVEPLNLVRNLERYW